MFTNLYLKFYFNKSLKVLEIRKKYLLQIYFKKRTICNINVIIKKSRINKQETTSFFGKFDKNIKVLQMQLLLFSLYQL